MYIKILTIHQNCWKNYLISYVNEFQPILAKYFLNYWTNIFQDKKSFIDSLMRTLLSTK